MAIPWNHAYNTYTIFTTFTFKLKPVVHALQAIMVLEESLGDIGAYFEENKELVAVFFLVLFKCL